ncbi:hypothetical protein [Psychrobium sp. 1_MG-2023]|uniref:hypothetical protein n=1 Tax=Psychrobium sp. 1_MG-2023 TaxID=3062624 RepID=UPI000C3472D7|nr:hypothetical protein [Psychrobium sp. 1_MG-2023]MDP2561644.1 hypothetical protein [Psychrobium sp. 1_MG-2023]PKF55661.1 hypothetical protein CW748_12450 [Alteromonadales bacterium alter-6D02]
MHAQFFMPRQPLLDVSQVNFQRCILVGNWTMLVSLLITTICLLVTFQFEQSFSLSVQVFAHIATMLFAASFKLGYVIRCIGAYGLGCKDF